jgi:hypothetical protein
MAGPLALLGDAIASGTADYANIQREEKLHARDRGERLADVAATRQFEVEQQKAGWTHEETVYNQRRFDALKASLVGEGYLDPKDQGTPEALVAAVKAMQAERGPQAVRDLQELANYKAALPQVIKGSKGKAGDLSWIENATVKDLDAVRQAFQEGWQSVADEVKSDDLLKTTGDKNVAMMIQNGMTEMGRISADQQTAASELDRITLGQFNPAEQAHITDMAKANPLLAGKSAADLLKPSGKELLRQAQEKAAKDYVDRRGFELQKRIADGNKKMAQANAVVAWASAADRTGAAGYMDMNAAKTALTPAAPAPSGGAGAGAADAADYLKIKKPPPAAVTPAPAGVVDAYDQGGVTSALPILAAKTRAALMPSWPQAISDVIQYAPGTLNYMVGGEKRFQAGEAERDAQSKSFGDVLDSMGNNLRAKIARDRMPPQPALGDVNMDALPSDRAQQDRILASEPYSDRARYIRRLRGIPEPTPPTTPAALIP